MEREFNELIALIAEQYHFNEEKYPELKGATEEEKKAFAIRHLALHFSKTAGKVAAVSEDVDHGGKFDYEDLQKNTIKALINTLRLAELVGMTGEDILKALKEHNYNPKPYGDTN